MALARQGPEAAAEVLIVREAGIEDVGAVHDLLYEFNGEALPLNTLAFRMQQTAGLESVFLAERGGRPAGLLVLRVVPTISGAQDWAEITELFVRPPLRRQGTGVALVRAALERSRSRGCIELNLLVDLANVEALTFYRACGFRRDSCAMRCPVQGS
jgi:ribosomal protein S18 acetylase RimI-like enzyme